MLAQTPAMALAAEMPQEIVDEAELILEEEAGAEETASVEAAATETLSVEGIEEVASETDYPESEETEIADSTESGSGRNADSGAGCAGVSEEKFY